MSPSKPYISLGSRNGREEGQEDRSDNGLYYMPACYNDVMAKRQIAMVVTKIPIRQRKTDFAFWQSQSYQARLDAAEQIRQEYHRWRQDVQPGLQRVCRITKRS